MNNQVEKSNLLSVGKNGLESLISVTNIDIERLKRKASNELSLADKAVVMQQAVNLMAVVKILQDNIQDVFKKLGYSVTKAFNGSTNLQELYSNRINSNTDYDTAINLVNEIHSLLEEAIERKNSICQNCNGSGDSLSGSNPNSSPCSHCGGTGAV